MRTSRDNDRRQFERVTYSANQDETDPEWLEQNTDVDTAELWLCVVGKMIEARAAVTSDFSDWDVEFFKSINEQYDRRMARSYDKRPLSGKQLFHLHRLYMRCGKIGAKKLERFIGE